MVGSVLMALFDKGKEMEMFRVSADARALLD
jgi:hypothetical protein